MTNPYIQKLISNLRNCLVAKITTLWIIVDFASHSLSDYSVKLACLIQVVWLSSDTFTPLL